MPYNFTNEKIEQLMRGKSDGFEWKGAAWREIIILNWYMQHCQGFIRKSRLELKRSLNFGGPLGRAIDRALDLYALLQNVVPVSKFWPFSFHFSFFKLCCWFKEQSVMLNPVRESIVSLLRLAQEVENVVSQKFKGKVTMDLSPDLFGFIVYLCSFFTLCNRMEFVP